MKNLGSKQAELLFFTIRTWIWRAANITAWWFQTWFYDFPLYEWIILPIDELHHFSRWLKHVKTTNQISKWLSWRVFKWLPCWKMAVSHLKNVPIASDHRVVNGAFGPGEIHQLYEGTARRSTRALYWLVVWNMFFEFPYIGNVIIPTDKLIFSRGVGIPPTRGTWRSMGTLPLSPGTVWM